MVWSTSLARSIERIVLRFAATRGRFDNPRLAVTGWLIAGALFSSMMWFAWTRLPTEVRIEPIFIALGLLLSLAILWVTSYEVRYLGGVAAVSIDAKDSFSIMVIASLANLAPIPGSVGVRLAALIERGALTGSALIGMAQLGANWVSVGVLLGGFSLLSLNQASWLPYALVASGLAGTIISGLTLRRATSWKFWLSGLGIETALVVLSAFAIQLSISALGIGVSVAQATVLAMTSILATSVGFFPMGLGLAELLAALIADSAGLDESVAVLGSIVSRVLSLASLSIASLALPTLTRRVPSVDAGHQLSEDDS